MDSSYLQINHMIKCSSCTFRSYKLLGSWVFTSRTLHEGELSQKNVYVCTLSNSSRCDRRVGGRAPEYRVKLREAGASTTTFIYNILMSCLKVQPLTYCKDGISEFFPLVSELFQTSPCFMFHCTAFLNVPNLFLYSSQSQFLSLIGRAAFQQC